MKTPAYIIDESKLKENLEIFHSIKQATQCSVIMALKAYSCYETFPLMREYLDGCTASSINEAILAHKRFGKDVHIYSPAYTDDQVETIAGIATHVVFNSHSQQERILKKIKEKNSKIQFALRLNPQHSEVNTGIYNPCAPCSRFGVTKKELNPSYLEGLDGVLVHALCGHDSYALERLLAAAEAQFSDIFHRVNWVDFGGGHMVTRPDYDREHLISLIKTFQKKYNVRVVLEPGESIVYKVGTLVATVVDILKNDMDIAILNTSATAHMPDILEMPYRPDIQNSGKVNEKAYSYRLGSSTCLAGDVIGDYSFDTQLRIGDVLTFNDMAQYTMVKNTTFNGIDLPDIVIKRIDGSQEVVKSFDYSDFERRI
jgi:carboxynorspermidine decarboxylase